MEVWGGGQGRQGRDSSDSFLAVLATPCTAGAQAAGETLGVCVTHISVFPHGGEGAGLFTQQFPSPEREAAREGRTH